MLEREIGTRHYCRQCDKRISNRFSVFENVCNLCDCVRGVCPHTNSIETFTSSMIRNCQNDNMDTTYLNAQITLNVQNRLETNTEYLTLF